jgi:multiple sugar transport system permease protein
MRARFSTWQQNLAAWQLAGPAAVLLIVLYALPILGLVALSTTDYELGATSVHWVGFQNFFKASNDAVFLRSMKNTLLYVGMVIPLSVTLGLVMALLVHTRRRSRGFYEVAYFLPVTATLIAMATVWQFLLHPKLGPVNTLLQLLGVAPQAFISEPGLVMPTLAFIGVWQLLGFNMVLFLAGLSNIPSDLYDAAAIDGADSAWDKFWVVTWPQLAPTTLFVTVTTSITAFKVFETVAALTQGRSGSEVLLYAIYLEGFQFFKMGYASALTMVFLVIILVLALVQMRLLDRKVHYA